MNRLHRARRCSPRSSRRFPLLGDVGVLIPSGSSAPDPAILSLDQMAVDIRIDNGDARVSIRQVFASHRGGVLEGEYLFSMPSRATVSDFAVWDGVTRIPGVILERRRAEEIYESLKQQQIDPGLLQQGERGTEGASEATRTSAFSARIVADSRVRHQAARDGVPRSRAGRESAIGASRCRSGPTRTTRSRRASSRISFSLVSAHAIRDFRVGQPRLPAAAPRADAARRRRVVHRPQRDVLGRLQRRVFARSRKGRHARSGDLSQSGAGRTQPDRDRAAAARRRARILPGLGAHRAGRAGRPAEGRRRAAHRHRALRHVAVDAVGEARAQLSGARGACSGRSGPAIGSTCCCSTPRPRCSRRRRSPPTRRRSRRRSTSCAPDGCAAAPTCKRALGVALDQSQLGAGDRYIVLLGDASATHGTIANAQLAAWYAARRGALPPAARPRTYLFGIGDDANVPLLTMLSRDDGVMDTVRSTEPIEFKMRAFVSKIGARPLEQAADDRRSAGRHRSRVSARSGVVCRVGRVLGRPLHAARRPRDLHRPRRARQPRDRDARHGAAARPRASSTPACRGPGRRRASTRCSTRSRATARTARAWTKSSSSRGSTSS